MVIPTKRVPAVHNYLKYPGLATESPWTVPALCARYKFPTGLAGGGVIGIIELGGGWTASDMTAYFASVGQPVPSITDVSVDGTTNTPGSDDDFEVALDIQVSAAAYYVATGKPATIRVYWVQDMATGLRAATKDGCSVFSMSWGAPESEWTSGTGAGSCADMQAAALAGLQAGMISFAASGDQGADDGTRKKSVDCPASCPSVIGCGGTTLTTTEVAWDDTGGGYSSVFPAQSWQVGIPAAPSGLGRMVPDVASCADPNTGIEIYCQGAATVVGGTSAAAPLWAGLVAACGVRLGSIAPTFYRTPNAFTDITSGSNGAYSAGVGPDPCSGMGSPLGAAIATMLGTTVVPPAPPSPPPPPPPPSPPTPGSPPSHAAVDAALAALQAATTAYEQAVANYAATLVRTGAPPQTAPGRPAEPRPEPPATQRPGGPQPRPEPPPPGHEPPGRGPGGGRGRP
jgi:kumamolisin